MDKIIPLPFVLIRKDLCFQGSQSLYAKFEFTRGVISAYRENATLSRGLTNFFSKHIHLVK